MKLLWMALLVSTPAFAGPLMTCELSGSGSFTLSEKDQLTNFDFSRRAARALGAKPESMKDVPTLVEYTPVGKEEKAAHLLETGEWVEETLGCSMQLFFPTAGRAATVPYAEGTELPVSRDPHEASAIECGHKKIKISRCVAGPDFGSLPHLLEVYPITIDD